MLCLDVVSHTVWCYPSREPVNAPMTPEQHLAYDQRFAQLQAEFDFNEKVNKGVMRRI